MRLRAWFQALTPNRSCLITTSTTSHVVNRLPRHLVVVLIKLRLGSADFGGIDIFVVALLIGNYYF